MAMDDVVIARWTGRLATALQAALRVTNEQFAADLLVATRTVATWHERPDSTLSEPNQQALDTTYQRADGQVRARFALLTATSDTASAVSATSIEPVEPWELVDALTHSSIGGEALSELERAVLEYATRYPAYGPAMMQSPVARLTRRLKDALAQPQSLSERRRCITLLGILAGVSGNLSMDLAQQDRAAAMFDVGRAAGREVDDNDLAAWVTANESIGKFFAGHYADAVDQLEYAVELSDHGSSHRRRSWIVSMQARALAAAGQPDDARRALDRSRTLMEEAIDPPGGTDFFDGPRLDGFSGTCMLLLRDTGAATELLSRALHDRSPRDLKGRALVTLDLAECRVIDSEPDEASTLAIAALDLTDGTVVRPIVERANRLRQGLTKWSGSRALAELDARLAAASEPTEEA